MKPFCFCLETIKDRKTLKNADFNVKRQRFGCESLPKRENYKQGEKKKKSSPPCHFAKLLPAHSCSKLPPLLCSVKRFSPVFLYQPEGGQGDQTKTTPSHPNNPPKRTRGAFWSPWWSTPRSASAHLPPATSTACIQLAATNWAAWRVAASGHNSISHQVLLFYTFCWCEWPHKRRFFYK